MRRTIVSFLFVATIVVLLILVLFRRTPESIESVVPEGAAPVFMLSDNYHFRQDDPKWGQSRIGDTEDRLFAYGCTVSSVAMAASNLLQTEITPESLNQKLSNNGGYTDRGWLIWDEIAPATHDKVAAKYYSQPRHEDILSCMSSGSYPVIKIKLYDSIIHWVLVVGSTQDQYLIRDPLVGSGKDKPIELKERSSTIDAVRCIHKSEPDEAI